MKGKMGKVYALLMLIISLAAFTGCASMDKAQIGGLTGAGIGALAGQLIGGNTAGTLIGAGVGLGLGYIVGNEMDKNDVKKRQALTQQEMEPLANTAWQLISINPKPKEEFVSKAGRFNADGTLTTTTVYADGLTKTKTERYRVVGDTLIINHDDYVVNMRFKIDGSRMYMEGPNYSLVLQRI